MIEIQINHTCGRHSGARVASRQIRAARQPDRQVHSPAQGAVATKGTGKTVTNIIRLFGDGYRRFLSWQEIRARREAAERDERPAEDVIAQLPLAGKDAQEEPKRQG